MSEDRVDLHPPADVALTEYERELVKKVGFGLEVENFIHSNVGEFIFSRAAQIEAQADIELRTVNPTDVAEICRLQIESRAMGFLKEWLEEQVRLGIEAQESAESPPE